MNESYRQSTERTRLKRFTPHADESFMWGESRLASLRRSGVEMSGGAAPRERESIQKQIQQDWANREYIEVITGSIKKITDFLNSFDLSCRSRLAVLNEKLTTLERRIDYLEACVTKGETLT